MSYTREAAEDYVAIPKHMKINVAKTISTETTATLASNGTAIYAVKISKDNYLGDRVKLSLFY